ncbi:hypothetical protein CR203_23445 [Salipaludibacillus neizhouensis]|uniref:Uncharacterized protein n=1 Tax=Salipaludibacillus neizhouensis TaxID=885475 RepID=A0A3A9KJ98_9BACI|nr:hypothetical protein CR203_23445 [Salipaludibacillus neizhouensis]
MKKYLLSKNLDKILSIIFIDPKIKWVSPPNRLLYYPFSWFVQTLNQFQDMMYLVKRYEFKKPLFIRN